MTEAVEVALAVSLVILALANLAVSFISRKYIQSKPFGATTTYDLLHCDLMVLLTIVVIFFCLALGSSLLLR